MRAVDIMTRPAVSVHPQTSVGEAVAVLSERGFAGLPVVDDNGRVVGIFTEADAPNSIDSAGELRVDAMMSTPVEVATPETHVTSWPGGCSPTGCAACRSWPTACWSAWSAGTTCCPLVRSDDTIAAYVRVLLDDYSNKRDHWHVAVSHGAVTISGAFTDEAERAVVAALARTVLGVTTVETSLAAPLRTSSR